MLHSEQPNDARNMFTCHLMLSFTLDTLSFLTPVIVINAAYKLMLSTLSGLEHSSNNSHYSNKLLPSVFNNNYRAITQAATLLFLLLSPPSSLSTAYVFALANCVMNTLVDHKILTDHFVWDRNTAIFHLSASFILGSLLFLWPVYVTNIAYKCLVIAVRNCSSISNSSQGLHWRSVATNLIQGTIITVMLLNPPTHFGCALLFAFLNCLVNAKIDEEILFNPPTDGALTHAS